MRISNVTMAAHLKLEHGWSWERIKKAFADSHAHPHTGTWEQSRWDIEYEIERMKDKR